jgi:hypothetical protein
MFEIKKQVVHWDDTLWVVKRKIPESYNINVSEYKTYLGADKVAKKGGYYFFLEEIKEVEIIEEIPYSQENTPTEKIETNNQTEKIETDDQ